MNLWSKIQIGLILIAIALIFVGDKFSVPISFYAGIATIGLTFIVVGMEASLTRRIVLSRQRSYDEAYQGWIVYAQGVQFNLIGLFFIGAALVSYFDSGDALFSYFVKRPWAPLVVIGTYCLMQAVIVIGSSVRREQDARWVVILDFILARLLPGAILILIGLSALGLGIFEFIAPAQFDTLGGGFLEALFGG